MARLDHDLAPLDGVTIESARYRNERIHIARFVTPRVPISFVYRGLRK